MPETYVVRVFADGPEGGNPAPIVPDAAGMDAESMRAVARHHQLESGFVLPAAPGSGRDFDLRFWVPEHEREMCGHATVAAIWLLDRLGRLERTDLQVGTPSGVVAGRVVGDVIEVSQPAATVSAVAPHLVDEVLDVLGLPPEQVAPFPVLNASTSRTKTLIPVVDTEALDALRPDFSRVEEVCRALDSTGLYPWATSAADDTVFVARQFPRSSGYPEDAATGIAAAALAFGLREHGLVAARHGESITVRQGRAMGRPSRISLRYSDDHGIWLGGTARLDELR